MKEFIHCTHSEHEEVIVDYGADPSVSCKDIVKYTLCAICAKIVRMSNVNTEQ